MINSKDKRLKHLREREDKLSNENKELRESNEATKAEVLSMTDAVEKSISVEKENHAMKKRVIELEEEQKKKESNAEQLKKVVDVKTEEIKEWKEKHNQSEHRRSLSVWLGDNQTVEEKQKGRRCIRQAQGRHNRGAWRVT